MPVTGHSGIVGSVHGSILGIIDSAHCMHFRLVSLPFFSPGHSYFVDSKGRFGLQCDRVFCLLPREDTLSAAVRVMPLADDGYTSPARLAVPSGLHQGVESSDFSEAREMNRRITAMIVSLALLAWAYGAKGADRGVPPGCCGDTAITQNSDVADSSEFIVSCDTNGSVDTIENAWARCFSGTDFPTDFTL